MKTTRHALAVAHNALTLILEGDTIETFCDHLENGELADLEGMTNEEIREASRTVASMLATHCGEDIEVALPLVTIELAELCVSEGELDAEGFYNLRDWIADIFDLDMATCKTMVVSEDTRRVAFIDYPTEIVEDNREDFEDRMIDVADGTITVEDEDQLKWWVAFAQETAAVVKLTEEAFGDDDDAIAEAFEDEVYSLPIPMQNAAIRRIIANR